MGWVCLVKLCYRGWCFTKRTTFSVIDIDFFTTSQTDSIVFFACISSFVLILLKCLKGRVGLSIFLRSTTVISYAQFARDMSTERSVIQQYVSFINCLKSLPDIHDPFLIDIFFLYLLINRRTTSSLLYDWSILY